MEILNEAKNSRKNRQVSLDGKGPEKKFNINGVSATIWQNKGQNKSGEDITFRTISFEKNYKDKDGDWKVTNTLRINDLPKAALVLNKAYEYITMNPANAGF